MNLVDTPMVYAGGGFPWGLLIIGGILYVLWQKGVFGGPGGRGFGPGQGFGGPGGPRDRFEEWHREAHGYAPPQAPAQPAPTPPASPAPTAPEAAGQPINPVTPPAAPQAQPPQGEQPGTSSGGTGPALERW